jgi:hypothetical protein
MQARILTWQVLGISQTSGNENDSCLSAVNSDLRVAITEDVRQCTRNLDRSHTVQYSRLEDRGHLKTTVRWMSRRRDT